MSSGAGKRLEKRRGIGAKKSRDPFAVDFFDSESRVAKSGKKGKSLPEATETWHKGLDVVSSKHVRRPLTFEKTPTWIEPLVGRAIKNKIGNFSQLKPSQVTFKTIGFEKVDFASEESALSSRGNSIFRFSIGGNSGVIAIGRIFASDLIGLFLKRECFRGSSNRKSHES